MKHNNVENTALYAAGQVNATSSDEHYNYFNYMDNSVGGGGGGGDVDDSSAQASSSSDFDYVLPKLDQLTAPTDTLIRDPIVLKTVSQLMVNLKYFGGWCPSCPSLTVQAEQQRSSFM